LRLDRNDPGPQPSQARNTIANVGANIEYEVTWPDELRQDVIAPSTVSAPVTLVK
jgi:hypothetical protein